MRLTKLWCDPPQFQPIEFRSGLNIIMAHRTEGASATDTTNGVGKTTFAKIVDFCLLASVDSASLLRNPELQHLTFFLQFTGPDGEYVVSRSLQSAEIVTLLSPTGDTRQFKVNDARSLFGDLFLGTAPEGKKRPTFRQVMNYLIRDEKEGFIVPFESFRRMRTQDVVTLTLFLMDLDHTLPEQLEQIAKDREQLEQIAKGLRSNLEREGFSAKAALLTQRAEVARELDKREKQLNDFRVLPEYRELQHEVTDLAQRMTALRNKNFLEQRRVEEYHRLLHDETTQVDLDVAQSIYEELNVEFPQLLKRGLEEVIAFQKSVSVAERRFVEKEIRVLSERIEQRTRTIEELDTRRSLITKRLAEHGALDEYQTLSGLLVNLRERLATLDAYRRMFEQLEGVENDLSHLKHKEEETRSEIREYLRNSEQRLVELNMLFSNAFRSLYGHGAYINVTFPKRSFVLERTAEEGEEFESLGKNHASIFCYDIALLIANAVRQPFPHFVLHDGVFTGVDPRQVRNALQFVIESLGPDLQYICTMNSSEVLEPEKFNEYVVRHLTDVGPTGKLLNLQF